MQLAKSTLAKVLELAPDVVEPYLTLAAVYMETRTFDQALSVGEKLLAVRPKEARAHRIIGRALLAQGNNAKALDALKAVTEQAPQDASGYYDVGVAYRKVKQEAEALKIFEKALALEPVMVAAVSQIVEILVARGQPDKALTRVQQQLQRVPNEAAMHNLLGTVLFGQRQEAAAEQAWLKAIALNDNLPEPQLHLARLYHQRKAYAQAIQQCELVITRHPRLVAHYMLLGSIYQEQQVIHKANEAYQQALKLQPTFALAANNLAWNYGEYGGNLDEAIALARMAREQAPENPQVADTLGWLYYKKGEYT